MAAAPSTYPVRYSVDYLDAPRDRLSVAFRLLLAIPILVLFASLAGGGGSGPATWQANQRDTSTDTTVRGPDRGEAAAIGAGVVLLILIAPAAISALSAGAPATAPLAFPTALMLIFRRKYPRWFFDFTRETARFGGRVAAYTTLERDEYPSTDSEQAAHLEIDYPDATQLNRWLPIVKWFLAIPHYVVLAFLYLGLVFTTLIAWVAVLITGRYPRELFNYAVGVSRWTARVSGYAFLLVTDEYPPFRLD